MSSKDRGSCCRSFVNQSLHQNFNEMDFERGIWSAALNGEHKRLIDLLNKGIDPSIPDGYGFTALHYAARNGQKDACYILLKRNAKADAKTHSGATPLHRAAYQGHTQICRLLMDHGASPSLTDSDGKIPLHKAAENGHFSAVKVLIEKDATLKNIKDKKLRIPQDYVDPNKNKELYDILICDEAACD